jgi:hypothetical protein
MPQHVSAILLVAHTADYIVLAPEVCFQNQQVSLFGRPRLIQTGADTNVLAGF